MCFKTASLPAPSASKWAKKEVKADFAAFYVKAVGTREVRVAIGNLSPTKQAIGNDDFDEAQTSQVFGVAGLRELAAKLNKLADKLEA